MAVVLPDRAAIFVDGRYTLQVEAEVDTSLFEPRHLTEQPAWDWVAEALPSGGKLGYDPWLLTESVVGRLRRAAAQAGGSAVAVADNPVDAVWTGQPAAPIA